MARFGYNSGIDQYGLSGNTRGRGDSSRYKTFGAPGSRAGTSLKPPGGKGDITVLPPPKGGGDGKSGFDWRKWGVASLGYADHKAHKEFAEHEKKYGRGSWDIWKTDPGKKSFWVGRDKNKYVFDDPGMSGTPWYGGWHDIRWGEGTRAPTLDDLGYKDTWTNNPNAHARFKIGDKKAGWEIRLKDKHGNFRTNPDGSEMWIPADSGLSDGWGVWWRGDNPGGMGGNTGGTMGGTMGGMGDGMASMGSGLSGPPASRGMFPGSRESDKGPFTDPSTVPGTKSNMQAQQRANPPGGPRTKGLSTLGDLSPTPSSSLSGPPAGNMAGNQQQKTDAQAPIDRLREIMGGTNQMGTEAGSAPQPSVLDLVNKRQAEKNTLAPPPQEQAAPQQQVPQQQVSGFYAGDPSKGIPGEWDHMKGKWPSQTLSGALRDRKEQAGKYTPPGKDPAPPGKVWRISGWTGQWVLVDEGVMT